LVALLVGSISALCSRSCFEAVESAEKVLDVSGKFLARNIFRRPSERCADAIEEVDVVNADCVFGLVHRDYVDSKSAVVTNGVCSEDSVRLMRMLVLVTSLG